MFSRITIAVCIFISFLVVIAHPAFGQPTEEVDIFFTIETQISSMRLLGESENSPFGVGYEGDINDKFSENNRAGRIAVLDIDHNHINGFTISVVAESDGITNTNDNDVYGERLDFNSSSEASNDVGYIEVPYKIDCDDYDEYEYNPSIINSYIKNIVELESSPENICLETDEINQQSMELLIGVILTIPDTSESFFLYDELGYRTETITFTLADKV